MYKIFPLKNRRKEMTPLELIAELQDNLVQIEDELVGNLLWYSPDAHFVPNSVNIISLEYLGESRYKMNYSFRWNVFNACLDIDADETSYNSVNFVLTESAVKFDFIDDEPSAMSDEL